MPRRSFEESIAEFSNELAQLASSPQSPSAHSDIAALRDKLTALLDSFLSCEACGQPFPTLAQVKWGEVDAKVCTECGISILQGVAPEAAATRKKSRSRKPAKSAQGVETASPQPSTDQLRSDASEEVIAVVDSAPPNNSSGPGATNSKTATPSPKPVRKAANSETSRLASAPGTSSASNASTPKSRSAEPAPAKGGGAKKGRGKNAKTVTVEADPSAVAKKLGVKISEVKRVAGLMKELLPAMELAPTVAYVSAEMRNARMKFQEKDVAAIVKQLSVAPKQDAAPKK